ncbi:hypothetical protein [Acinetobacter soli]|uniref:hypothetical protein n=1 Tax=Acinetobacter soli TaxID=487316 RepID=UPI000DD06B4B|nr:hypothetical protein [Acinetobacter soli]
MLNNRDYLLNKAYNTGLTKLVLWYLSYRRVELDVQQDFSVVKNKEKLDKYTETVKEILDSFEQLDRSKVRSYFPLMDDQNLIALFKDTVK